MSDRILEVGVYLYSNFFQTTSLDRFGFLPLNQRLINFKVRLHDAYLAKC